MSNGRRETAIGLALLVADPGALLLLRPHWSPLFAGLSHPRQWIDQVGIDRAIGQFNAAVLWCVAAWLALGIVTSLAATLPGRAGSLGQVVVRCLLPRVAARAIAAAVGVSVALIPAVAGATPMPSAPSTAATATGPSLVSPIWPTDSSSTPATAPVATPPTATAVPVPATATPPPAPKAQPSSPPVGSGDRVTVTPGDSLWLIAAHRLGPAATDAQIAATWKQWYAANASVIGADPALIHPGVVLEPPVASDGSARK